MVCYCNFLEMQYAKCKEELRLTRFRSVEDGTVNIQHKISRPQCVTADVQMQTDPISDKGFGVSNSFLVNLYDVDSFPLFL